MADYYDKALKLMHDHDLENAPRAYALLEQAREQGDYRATYAIGTWYLHGFYFGKNVRKGITMIAEAAEHDVSNAAFDLAYAYETGTARKINEKKALCYYMRAFLLGDNKAAREVGRLLHWGGPSVRNRALAREFYDLVDRNERQ